MKILSSPSSRLESPAVAAPSALRTTHSTLRTPHSAFTMIEIAISLAVIGFALVAIVGILPMAMNVQKDNRQETIINQDASIFMSALRNGSRGLDDLTNYVLTITNYAFKWNASGTPPPVPYTIEWYTSSNSWNAPAGNGSGTRIYALTNGFYIVGLLSTPKIMPIVGPQGRPLGFISNHVVACCRSMSGPASEKFPQTNSTSQEFALSYRLICDVSPYGTNYYNPDWTNYADPAIRIQTNIIAERLAYFIRAKYYETNMHDVRLTFRWPLLPNGNSGPGRQVFRTLVRGTYTNDWPGTPFYFFQPNIFFRGSTNQFLSGL